jgi:hypothetical protein
MTLAAVGYHLPEPPPPDKVRFATYTLFLATDTAQNTPEHAKLEDEFDVFAARIGDTNAAVWVKEPNIPGLSVSKGQELIRRYRIAYDNRLESRFGPFVVVSELHPKEWPSNATQRNERGLPVAFSFRERSPQGIRRVLDCLEECLRSSSSHPPLGVRVVRCNACGLVVLPGTIDQDEAG